MHQTAACQRSDAPWGKRHRFNERCCLYYNRKLIKVTLHWELSAFAHVCFLHFFPCTSVQSLALIFILDFGLFSSFFLYCLIYYPYTSYFCLSRTFASHLSVHLVLVLVGSNTLQGSINWLVCVYCGYNVLILWGLTDLVSLFENTYAMQTLLALRVVTVRVLVVLSSSERAH